MYLSRIISIMFSIMYCMFLVLLRIVLKFCLSLVALNVVVVNKSFLLVNQHNSNIARDHARMALLLMLMDGQYTYTPILKESRTGESSF
jgi:hypothetical protein